MEKAYDFQRCMDRSIKTVIGSELPEPSKIMPVPDLSSLLEAADLVRAIISSSF